MLSSLINGKTVSLTKIVNFVLCVCMCTVSLSLSHTRTQAGPHGRQRKETIRSPEAGVTAK